MLADCDFDYDPPSDVRDEMAAERRRRARLNHWCAECHGFTGPNSPCWEPEESEENE